MRRCEKAGDGVRWREMHLHDVVGDEPALLGCGEDSLVDAD